MDVYRKKLQVKLYSLKYGLFFREHFYELLQHTKILTFSEFDHIKLPIQNDHLFFINEGLVAGTLEKKVDTKWYRLVKDMEVFGNFQELTGIEIPKFYWHAVTKVELMAIPINILVSKLSISPPNLENLVRHLSSVEIKRMHFLNHLSKLSAIEKFNFLESEIPELILKTRTSLLSNFLGLTRETLSRILKEKMHQPSLD
ncbi:hypothetical protein [Aquiflexum sp.]|uniref:hypothetical protein n=1 Tax=Aquiflexum sp. TaxID=1872584 RepID=UPI0035932A01